MKRERLLGGICRGMCERRDGFSGTAHQLGRGCSTQGEGQGGWHAPVNSSFIMRLVIAPFRLISLATMRRHRRRQLPPKLLRPTRHS